MYKNAVFSTMSLCAGYVDCSIEYRNILVYNCKGKLYRVQNTFKRIARLPVCGYTAIGFLSKKLLEHMDSSIILFSEKSFNNLHTSVEILCPA